ncbi:MAG: class II glutamine amidotransferase [bacterium]
MCSIFGIAGFEKDKEVRMRFLEEIGIEGQSRGIEATGIATIEESGKTFLQKQSVEAMKFDWGNLPKESMAYQGHTRFSTGSPIDWANNHPFVTEIEDGYRFTVTHNGLISNDDNLKEEKELDDGGVECDSYVVNLLLENVMFMQDKKELDIEVVKEVAELLKGSYSIVVMDNKGRIFFFRNTNPCKYIHTEEGLMWASTDAMLYIPQNMLQIKIDSKIKSTDAEKIYEYDIKNNEFVNVKSFQAQYSYGKGWKHYSNYGYTNKNYNSYGKSYNSYNNTDDKDDANDKTNNADGEFIWRSDDGEYYYFESQNEFADFIYDGYGGQKITDKKTIETLENRRKNKKKSEKVECPVCKIKSSANDYLSYESLESFAELKEKDEIWELVECPTCQNAILVEELIKGEAIYHGKNYK